MKMTEIPNKFMNMRVVVIWSEKVYFKHSSKNLFKLKIEATVLSY